MRRGGRVGLLHPLEAEDAAVETGPVGRDVLAALDARLVLVEASRDEAAQLRAAPKLPGPAEGLARPLGNHGAGDRVLEAEGKETPGVGGVIPGVVLAIPSSDDA